jgi:hypothetical protein
VKFNCDYCNIRTRSCEGIKFLTMIVSKQKIRNCGTDRSEEMQNAMIGQPETVNCTCLGLVKIERGLL